MSRLLRRGPDVPAEVIARAGLGRRRDVLAATAAEDGTWLLGTRDNLVVVPPADDTVRMLRWESLESADWSRDDSRLRVAEVGEYGEPRPQHTFVLDDPGSFLPMVRERVTASVVLQRRVVVSGGRGLFVVARRAPGGSGEIRWAYEFDPDVDPADPEVRRLAEAGLRAAAEELGLG